MFTKITSHGDPDMPPSFSPARSANPGPSAAEMVAIHANSRIGRSAISQPTHPSLEQLLLARGAAGLGDILKKQASEGHKDIGESERQMSEEEKALDEYRKIERARAERGQAAQKVKHAYEEGDQEAREKQAAADRAEDRADELKRPRQLAESV